MNMKKIKWVSCVFLLGAAGLAIAPPLQAQTNNEIFEKMVGPQAKMDPAVVAQVLKDGPGKKTRIDADGDGRIDTLYFIDTDSRHSGTRDPILVKVVDEDGDMDASGEGDLDSDLYVADWYGDGTVDRVIDYLDTDGDGDLDEQLLYQWAEYAHFKKTAPHLYHDRAYAVAWAKDIGDDNRLWYDVDYEYNQGRCQWKTDFNGDEVFIFCFFFDYDENRFYPGFENPFAFYDLDGDHVSEEVVRVGAAGTAAENLRYSMDLDNTAGDRLRHSYDFSVTAVGPVGIPRSASRNLVLRGIPTGDFLAWEEVRPLAKGANWPKAHLTWNENGNNIDIAEGNDHSERWEGVINFGNELFAQMGGPTCGPFNKRNEVDRDNSGRFRMYVSPVDQRLHLHGAETGWLQTDYDYDGRPEMKIAMEDTDLNGFFDLWRYDLNGDGTFERECRVADDRMFLHEFEYADLRPVYLETLNRAIAGNQKLIDALKSVLGKKEKPFAIDAVERYFSENLVRDYDLGFGLGKKIRASGEGTRYYQDLIRERYWDRLLKTDVARSAGFGGLRDAIDRGEYARAAELLRALALAGDPGRTWMAPFRSRFTVELVNRGARALGDYPFVVNLRDLRRQIPDFNPSNFALVEPEPRIDWREVPAQADDLDGDGKPDELVFVHSVPAAGRVKLHGYYSPSGKRQTGFVKNADTARNWDSPEGTDIAWESNLAAYRTYEGVMEAFGKRHEGLILSKLPADYHHMQPWGMDVLRIGEASGLGGITIWENGVPVPIRNPGGKSEIKIRNKVLASGPVRSLVEVEYDNIRSAKDTYRATIRFSAFAENPFSRQEIRFETAAGKAVEFSPGVQKLTGDVAVFDSGAGYLASWGFGEPEAGEIGLGLMFDPRQYAGIAETDLDRLVKLKTGAGKTLVYWVLGGWRKGLANPVAPSARDWAGRVAELGFRLRTPVEVQFLRE